MSVKIFVDQADGRIKKASFEALSYGVAVAKQLGVAAEAIVLGNTQDDLSSLGKYGITTVQHINNAALNHFDAQTYTKAIAAASNDAQVIVFSFGLSGKALAPRLSIALQAGLVAGAIALPDTSNGFVVKKAVFSGKAFANVKVNTAVKIIAINPNSYKIEEVGGTATVAELAVNIAEPKIKVTATNKVTGEIPLSEAELVVSGGRGLKGPENWHLVTDLAKEIGAATACSRAVADAHWRPHHEHVGQTGGAIAPNLYFAIGISGAIQHLAGVNRSKVIVVINKDPEAPFFKAADYGIVGDAFEVMPKIVEAVKKLNA
jgi:electron transfer flavoprotein alpha subunit